jgi:cytochrome c553
MNASLPLIVAILVTTSACSNLERSRNLENDAVPVSSTALQVCGNCHGIDGNSVSPNFPNLAGQPKAYLVEELEEFRNKSRADKAAVQYMWGLTRNLTDAQIDGLAAYYSSQQPRSLGGGDSTRIAMGKEIFLRGNPAHNLLACATCHGETGQGTEFIPRLASQHAPYVVKQLTVYQGSSERPTGVVMTQMCKGMSEQEMADVAQYVQGMAAQRLVENATNERSAETLPSADHDHSE